MDVLLLQAAGKETQRGDPREVKAGLQHGGGLGENRSVVWGGLMYSNIYALTNIYTNTYVYTHINFQLYIHLS